VNHKKDECMLFKRICFIAGCIVCIGSASGCSGFGEEAPLSDGLYLNYDCGGSTIRVTFSEIDADSFSATLSFGVEEDSGPDSVSAQTREIVNRKLKTDRGTVYEAGILGPLWIPSSAVKKGGNAHGDEVIEVREWEGWDVGVVKADFGQGALRGEWYYDTNTGFLVGGMRATIMNADEGGTVFVLVDSNLPDWAEAFE
jgi:hypothetical protein